MGNIIDHRMLLSTQANKPNVSKLFNDALMNVSNIEKLKQQKIQGPLQNALLQSQISNYEQRTGQAREKARAMSVIQGANKLLPFLKNGDQLGAVEYLESRKQSLIQQGLPTQDTDEAINLIDTNPQLLLERTQSAVDMGKQMQQGTANKNVQTSKLFPNGTSINVLRDGSKIVTDGQGNLLQGDAASNAIAAAIKSETDLAVAKAGGAAQAKSDVAIDEVLRLENESEEKRLAIAKKKLTIDETKIANKDKRKAAIDAKNQRRSESEGAVDLVKELLDGDLFSSAFGRFNNAPPEGLRAQSNIDARAQVDRINGLLSLESRQKLKGSGTISDGEQKILGQSATILLNPLISDNVARRELRRVQRVFEDAADRNRLKRETVNQEMQTEDLTQFKEGQTASNAQGQRIVFTGGNWIPVND